MTIETTLSARNCLTLVVEKGTRTTLEYQSLQLAPDPSGWLSTWYYVQIGPRDGRAPSHNILAKNWTAIRGTEPFLGEISRFQRI